jgi:hypothetical protein
MSKLIKEASEQSVHVTALSVVVRNQVKREKVIVLGPSPAPLDVISFPLQQISLRTRNNPDK